MLVTPVLMPLDATALVTSLLPYHPHSRSADSGLFSTHVPTQTRVAGGLMPAKSGRDWTLADLTQENWVKVFNDLNLSGMTHGIAANMVFAQRQGTKLQFTLQQGQSSMLNDTHQDRMREALEAMFGCNLELTINIGETQVETPFANRQRRETEHQQQAIMALENDANVASLTTAFNGQLDTNSVLPVNPIET